jgi:hypothetical protein
MEALAGPAKPVMDIITAPAPANFYIVSLNNFYGFSYEILLLQ